MPETGRSVRDDGYVRRHAATLAAGLALSERTRGRAEFFRVINRTKSKNDYDFEARTIDALIALAATNHLNDTRLFDNAALAPHLRVSDQEHPRPIPASLRGARTHSCLPQRSLNGDTGRL